MATGVVDTLAELGAEHALVVYGHDGLDELTVASTSTVHELCDGQVRVYDIDPADYGIPLAERVSLLGGDAPGNADVVRKVLDGAIGPVRDLVVLNAGAALLAAGLADGLADG